MDRDPQRARDPLPSAPRVPPDMGRYAALGLQYALTIALLGALGWWLDSSLGTSPWLLVTGLFLGAISGFTMIVRAVPPARGRRRGGPE